jgi:hypothetical protein
MLRERLDALMVVLERNAHSEAEFEEWCRRLPSEQSSLEERFKAAVVLSNVLIPEERVGGSARLTQALLEAAREVVGATHDQREAHLIRLAEVVEQINAHAA